MRAITPPARASQLAEFPRVPPAIALLDAHARASGTRPDVAFVIGRAIFETRWPAQVLNVYADGVERHLAVGLRLSGVKFHTPLSRPHFVDEVAQLAARAFATAHLDEVDIWVTVPLTVGKSAIVSGDLAQPTNRTVFSVSVQRGESEPALAARLRSGRGIYWDQDWARSALK